MPDISSALSDPELGFLSFTVRRMLFFSPCRNCAGIANAHVELIDALVNSPV